MFSVVEIPADKSNFVQHGHLFHVKLLTLFLLRANYYKGYESFCLSSEISEANSFDDIVFCYEKIGESGLFYRLLQVKSKESLKPEGIEKITASDLLSTNDKSSFALQKYFISFLKVQNSCSASSGSLFAGGKIEDVILITNTFFEPGEVVNNFIEDSKKLKEDALLQIDLQGTPDTKVYKIKYGETDFVKKLKTVLEAKSDNSELVSRLAQHLAQETIIGIQQKHFNEYRFALIREVFEIDTPIRKTNSTSTNNLSAKLKASFINNENSDPEIVRFRSSLFKEYKFLTERFEGCFTNFPVRKFSDLSIEQKTSFIESIVGSIVKCVNGKYAIDTSDFDDMLANEIINAQTKKFHSKFLDEFLNKKELKNSIIERIGELTNDSRITWEKIKFIEFSLASEFGENKLPHDREVLQELATILVKAIKDEFKENIQDIPPEFRKYIPALMKEVIDISAKTFQQNFKSKESQLSAAAILFRQFVISEYFGESETKEAAKSFVDKKLKITRRLYDDIKSAEEPQISDDILESFVPQLLQLVNRRVDESDVITINNSAIETVINVPNDLTDSKKRTLITDALKTFNNTMKILAGHVFVERYSNIVFSKRFISSQDLKGSLKNLRNKLLENKKPLDQMKFSIKGLNSFNEDLFNRILPKVPKPADVESFCEHFYLVLNYPDRKQINAIIESDLQKNTETQCVALIQGRLETSINDWAANRTRTFFDKSSTNQLFKSIENITNLNELHGFTRCYFSTIKKDLQYDEQIIQDLLSEIKKNKILHVASEDLELGRTLVVQSFRKLQESADFNVYTFKHGHLFFSLQLFSDGEFKEQLSNIMRQKYTPLKLIVIECSEKILVKDFSLELNNLIPLCKKIIFVSKSFDDFSSLFEENPELKRICNQIPRKFNVDEGNLSTSFQALKTI